MNELINVTLNDNHEPVVSGRQLHEALGVKTKYADWFNRMIEYGFTENQDFLLLKNEQQTGRGGHNKVDHIIKHGQGNCYDPADGERQASPTILYPSRKRL
ncbi:phage antirepressor protein [Streptococcus pneumoniae]|nr:phage antirepressor protein [Streptococcus pneumoniae]